MTDTFRKNYHVLHEDNSRLINEMKSAFESVEQYLKLIKSREMALALTNLEQASMWATKAIVLKDEETGGQSIMSPKTDELPKTFYDDH